MGRKNANHYSATPDAMASTTLPHASDNDAALLQIAERIRRTTAHAILTIGRDLVEAKRLIGHGNFIAWLKNNTSLELRTAQNIMRAVTSFEDKYETISHLPQKTIYLLAAPSTSAGLRHDVVASMASNHPMSTDDIALRLAQEKEARKEAKWSPKQKRKREKALKDKKKREAKHDLVIEERRREWAEECERRAQNAKRAADLVRQEIGDKLSELRELLQQANMHRFRELI